MLAKAAVTLNILSDAQLDIYRNFFESFSLIHPAVYKELRSQDLVTQLHTDGQGLIIDQLHL